MTDRSFTEADLLRPGAPLRLRDVSALTGLDGRTIMRAVDEGKLIGFQFLPRTTSPWLFERRDVLAWWHTVKRDGVPTVPRDTVRQSTTK
jgi:hypothetical protein